MPDENASLQVRRRGVRRRGVRPSFGLPVLPGTPFFPFFSSLFVFCLAVENGEFQSSCGVGERRRPRSCCVVVLLLLVPLVSFFFFLFWPSKMEESGAAASSGRGGGRGAAAELLRRRSRAVGEEEDSPTQNDVVLGWFDFFLKSKHPKTASF